MHQSLKFVSLFSGAGGLGGLGDVGASGADAERLCAEKNGLVKRDGEWHRR